MYILSTVKKNTANVCCYSICDLVEKVEFKCFEVSFERTEPLFNDRRKMEIGIFYYIDDQYFKDFLDPYLMQNKEKVNE